MLHVLVVEDHEPFRRFVCSKLGRNPEWQVICEASDGLEAVQKANELQPDLVLLDIGLPTLDGMKAARRIRATSPKSKILFLTLESSADIVQECLNLGALGYVLKKDAGSDLLPAVDAVCQGRRFVSRSLSHYTFFDAAEEEPPPQSLIQEVPSDREVKSAHEVHFYSDDASLVVGFARFIEAALERGSAVIALTTESHRTSLLQRLQADGIDCAEMLREGRYIALDVADIFRAIMVNGLPDAVPFWKVAGELVTSAATAAKDVHPRVAACGECAPTLWTEGNLDAAIQLERLWDQLARAYKVDTLCGYVLNSECQPEKPDYARICAEHSAVSS